MRQYQEKHRESAVYVYRASVRSSYLIIPFLFSVFKRRLNLFTLSNDFSGLCLLRRATLICFQNRSYKKGKWINIHWFVFSSVQHNIIWVIYVCDRAKDSTTKHLSMSSSLSCIKHQEKQQQNQTQNNYHPKLELIFRLQQLGQLSHNHPKLLFSVCQIILKIIQHFIVLINFFTYGFSHIPNAWDGGVERVEGVVLLAHH